ncbi:hypothetical protein EKO04_007990 [Ascochyta lentis]|uniref:Uncharacterized protein n=1 Tax=Ascochyta lentis TaxID=205686 RepID=A0A8H7J010_9PLEO|nr:hypothetical protein EKO04_007990 [Ascochyta lentis]
MQTLPTTPHNHPTLIKYSLIKYSLIKYSLIKYSLIKYSLIKYSLIKYSLFKYSLIEKTQVPLQTPLHLNHESIGNPRSTPNTAAIYCIADIHCIAHIIQSHELTSTHDVGRQSQPLVVVG